MSFAHSHPFRLWTVLAAALAALAVAVLALSAASPSRTALLSQLERPAVGPTAITATKTVGPGPVWARFRAGTYVVAVRLVSNRASRPDRVAVGITRAGRQVTAASVSVTYAMPSMNMWNVLTTRLTRNVRGMFAAREPELAMPGPWQVRVDVAPRGGAPFAVALEDRMRS